MKWIGYRRLLKRLLGLVVIAALLMAGSPRNSDSIAANMTDPLQAIPQPDALPLSSPPAQTALRGWIAAGNLPGLRWPDFTDFRDDVNHFYEAAGYRAAWLRGGQPAPQALAIAEVLRQAEAQGL